MEVDGLPLFLAVLEGGMVVGLGAGCVGMAMGLTAGGAVVVVFTLIGLMTPVEATGAMVEAEANGCAVEAAGFLAFF